MRVPLVTTNIVRRKLMPHQIGYIHWTNKNHVVHPACFLEMRLGKTLANIRRIMTWSAEGTPLIVAPMTVLQAWEYELKLEAEPFIVLSGQSYAKRELLARAAISSQRRQWVLINYDSLRSTPNLVFLKWFAVLLDESTAIKNPTAQISRLVCEGFRKVKHRIILSGLPSPEGELDLFQQFKFLHGQFLGFNNFYKFRNQYWTPGTGRRSFDWMITAHDAKTVKNNVHRLAYILRRQDVGMAGVKIRSNRVVQMVKEQEKYYRQAEEEFSTWVTREYEDQSMEELHETEHGIVRDVWCARFAGGCDADGVFKWDAKVKELINLAKGELKGQEVVVWFRFNAEIKAAEAALTRAGINCTSLTGEDDRETRTEKRDWFSEAPGSGRWILCQIALGKYGIDLSAADTAIYYSMIYSGEAIGQSEDRIFHPMKKSSLLYIYILSDNTIDEDIAYAASSKVTSAKMFMSKVRENFIRRVLK